MILRVTKFLVEIDPEAKKTLRAKHFTAAA